MQNRLMLLFLLISINTFCQGIKIDKISHDFGDLYAQDDRFVDFTITNNTSKQIFILRVDKNRSIDFLLEKDVFFSGESVKIRLQVKTKTIGKFKHVVPLYLSHQDEPILLKLSGNVKELNNQLSNMQGCPDFSFSPNSTNPTDFVLTIITIDANTKEPIEEVDVVMLQNGLPIGKITTNKNGRVKTQIPFGVTYFFAKNDNYNSTELAHYVNFNRNVVILELDRQKENLFDDEPITDDDEVTEVPEELETEADKDSLLPIAKLETLDRLELDLGQTNTIELDSTRKEFATNDFKELDKNDFNTTNFKPVNLVFVIDVSSSMRQEDRIELLKYSLYQLVDMLRPIDQMGLVAYSTKARVILPITKGDNKQEIKEIVEEMKASGLTAGAAGIKLGFKQVKKNYIADAHNQVVVITDGAFNTGETNYEKLFKRYLKMGITLSVVGIKSNEKAEISMREVANLGKGMFIPIKGLADAQENLKQAIRLGAFMN